MEVSEVDESVEALLRELHEKKQWLDTMISGLEAAVDSPEVRLIELAERSFKAHLEDAPHVDLERDGKVALASLARSVGATPQARRKRTNPQAHALST
jgi:phage terminase small subunit